MSAGPAHLSGTPGDRLAAAGAAGLRKAGAVLGAAGAALCLLALFVGSDAARRFSFAYLCGALFLWAVVLGSLFVVALQHITGAVWSIVIRRVAEMFAAAIGLVALLFLPVLAAALLGPRAGLFPWADPEIVRGDHLIEMKRAYLNVPFFLARSALFFALWIAYERWIVGRSLRQESAAGGQETLRAARRASGHFMIVFALSVTFAAIDWMMSLEPRWFSTLYGVYVWSGMVPAALAAITLAVLWLRRAGLLGDGLVRPDHLYNLGALLFAFVCFWGYLAASQFMLIWYANLPEESIFYVARMGPGWAAVSVALPVLRFAVPFLLLLPRRAKMSPRVLAVASLLVLAGQWLDLYWLVMPHFAAGAPVFGWQEFGPVLLMTGVLLLWAGRFVGKHAMLPAWDPKFDLSRDFHL